MKKLAFTIFAAAALVLPLYAQPAGPAYVTGLRVDIPFEFVIQNTTVPPGRYVIQFGAYPTASLMGSDRRYLFLTNPDNSYNTAPNPKLVFHRYGNQYFLSQIVGTSSSRELPVARVERELKKKTVTATQQVQTEIVLAMR